MPLTDAKIRTVQAIPGKTVKLSDGGGLQVWMAESGSKLWYLAYRFGGKQRKLAIGPYPRIGLKEARQRRDDAKRQIEAGVDPSLRKRLNKLSAASEQAATFEEVSAELLDKKRREGKAPKTLAKLEWLFGLAKPTLGPRPIAGITAPEILVALRSVEQRGRLETAKGLRSVVGEVFATPWRRGGRRPTRPATCEAHWRRRWCAIAPRSSNPKRSARCCERSTDTKACPRFGSHCNCWP
jgi:Arm DNA-binding domain